MSIKKKGKVAESVRLFDIELLRKTLSPPEDTTGIFI